MHVVLTNQMCPQCFARVAHTTTVFMSLLIFFWFTCHTALVFAQQEEPGEALY